MILAIEVMEHLPAEQNDDGVALSRDKAKHKHVVAAAVVAFWRGFSQGALSVQNDFLDES